MNTPLRIRAAAFSAAVVVSLVVAEVVALIGLPPESAQALGNEAPTAPAGAFPPGGLAQRTGGAGSAHALAVAAPAERQGGG
ncbi:hypothetical protein [Ideonella sp. YS5]|uniref:hypothetical protein n=1 Tax=Ideonella sp. YS5 TaxID=3453714 RepID=UPI003EEB6624